MTILSIKTASGMEFNVSGKNCTYNAEYNCFYMNGESFPAEIVQNIIIDGRK